MLAAGARFWFTLGAVACCLPLAAARADTVWLAPRGETHPARIRLTGQVLDYNGQHLEIKLADGSHRTVPAEQVAEVITELTSAHQRGDAARHEHDYRTAEAAYRQALQDEPREWVRRRLLAELVACHREQAGWEQALAYFQLLVRDDPQSPHFAAIPLAWINAQPAPALEQKARQWLAAPDAVTRLVGASHLLPTAARSQAIDELTRLTTNADRRVALLAEAQLWRTRTGLQATDLEACENKLARLPEALQPGPCFVLGLAHARAEQAETAALWLLRVPILHGQHHQLSSEALWQAAQLLERANQPQQARGLYQELVDDYAGLRAAALAQQRLAEL